MSEELKTFKEWNVLGFRVHKGSRAVSFRAGEPMFLPHQVYRPQTLTPSTSGPYELRSGCPDYDGDGGFWADWCDANDANY